MATFRRAVPLLTLLSLFCSSVLRAQNPVPSITSYNTTPSSITIGQTFAVQLTVSNNGGASNDGGLTLSFPQLNQSGDGSRVSGISCPSGFSAIVRVQGQQIFNSNGQPISASYLLVECAGYWAAGTSKSMSLTVTPRTTGTFYVQYRSAMATPSGTYVNAPGSSTYTDQQGWPVLRHTRTVNSLPDLRVTSASGTPTTIVRGSSLTVSFALANNGGTGTGAFSNEIRLSTNSSSSTFDGTYLGNLNSSGLNAGQSSSHGPSNFTVPSGTAPGTYYLKVKADAGNSITESDESNNVRVQSTPITVVEPAGDLTVTVRTHTSAPQSGARVECYVGSGTTPCAGSNAVQTTNGSGQASFTGLSPGSYNFNAKFLGPNPFDSEYELWNKSSITLAPGSNSLTMTRNQPYTEQLRIYRVSDGTEVIPGATVAPNTQLQIRATVRNGTSGSLNTRVRFLIDRNQAAAWEFDNTTGYQAIGGSGATATLTFNFTPTQVGTYSYVDRTETQTDGKTDAWNWVNTFIVANADLTVTVRTHTSVPQSGARVECYVGSGTTPCAGSNAVQTTNGSGQASFTGLPPGSYNFNAKFLGPNPFDSEYELWSKSPITVAPGANSVTMTRNQPYTEELRIYRVSNNTEVPPGATVPPGTQLQIRALVRNGTTGSVNARVRFLIDRNQAAAWDFDNTTGYQTIGGGGATAALTYNFTPTQVGTYSYVDRTETQTDGKTDAWNWVNTFIVANTEVDLIGSISDALPLPVAPGGKLALSAIVSNQGTGDAPANHFRVYLSLNSNPSTTGDPELSEWTGGERPRLNRIIPSVEAGSAVELVPAVRVPPLQSEGSYFIKFVADADNEIPNEISELNNVAVWGPVQVGAPGPGVTVITHGFQLPGLAECAPRWARTMAEAVRRRAGRGSIYFYQPTGATRWTSSGREAREPYLPCFSWSDPSPDPTAGEKVLIFDWARDSNDPEQGWSESAADALFSALIEGLETGLFSASDLSNIHLIGHSRGTVVNSEVAERLLAYGYPVRQITNLDPHWWGTGTPPIAADFDVNAWHQEYGSPVPPSVVAWSGVERIDTYYRWNSASPLQGLWIEGGANLDLSDYDISHSGVHTWYFATMDPDPLVVNDGDSAEIEELVWFAPGATATCQISREITGARRTDGYYFSRVAQAPESNSCNATYGWRTPQRFGLGLALQETLANGNFERGPLASPLSLDPKPGWYRHGGSGAVVAYDTQGVSNRALLLTTATGSTVARHNRLFVPAATDWLALNLRSTSPCSDPDDELKVSASGVEIGRLSGLCDLTGWDGRFLNVPPALRGKAHSNLEFSLIVGGQGGSTSILVDDVRWVAESPLPQPTSLAATATGTGTVGLSWVDHASNESGYAVQRALETGNFSTVATTSAMNGLAQWSDSGLQACTTYRYRVYAQRDGFPSPLSNEASVTTLGCALPAPSGLTVTNVQTNQVTLNWSDVAGETGYAVEGRLLGAGAWEPAGETGANVVVFTLGGLSACSDYEFQVLAVAGSTVSNPSNVVTARTSGCPLPPSAPSGLIADAVSSSAIALQWQDVAGESEYRIERKTGAGGTWSLVATLPLNNTSFVSSGLSACTTYYFRVAAANSAGASSYSSAEYATTLGCGAIPDPPSGLYLTPSGALPSVLLQWVDNSNNESGFRIERKDSGGAFTEIGTAPANSAITSDPTTAACTSYTYRVRAYNANGNSAYSNEASTTTSGCQQGIDVQPLSIDFGGVNLGLYAERNFSVTNTGASTLTGVASTTAPFSIVGGGAYSLPPGQSQNVIVRFTPTALQSYMGSVNFTGGGGAETFVWGLGTSETNPILSVSPGQIEFGEVTPGTSSTAPFFVQNTGGGTLSGTATSEGAPFSVTSGVPYNLNSGQGVWVHVEYAPTSVTRVERAITFTGAGTLQGLVRGGRIPELIFRGDFETGNTSSWNESGGGGTPIVLIDENFDGGIPPDYLPYGGSVAGVNGAVRLSGACLELPGTYSRSEGLALEADIKVDNGGIGDFNIWTLYDVVPNCQTGPTNGYYLGLYPQGSDNPNDLLGHSVNGSGTLLDSNSASMAAGQWHRIRFEIRASGQIRVILNGTEIMSASETTVGNGSLSLRGWANYTWVDNLLLTTLP